MLAGKEDIALSLSLGSSNNNANNNNNNNNQHIGGFMFNQKYHHHHQQHQQQQQQPVVKMVSSNNNTATPLQLKLITPHLLQKLPWCRSNDSFPLSPSDRVVLKGIDVNKPAGCGGGDEDDSGVSSTVSTVSGSKRSAAADDGHELERASSRGVSEDEDGRDNCRKKLRLSKDQSAVLEDSFKEHNTLNPKQKLALAKRLGLRPRQVEVWFQNRRARTKLKQTEVDCELLKRCCEQLTEENRRLQKEVQELRALKLSPQFYMHMTPPTTLTMCPSCERVAGPAQPDLSPQHRPFSSVTPWPVAAPLPIRSFEAAV